MPTRISPSIAGLFSIVVALATSASALGAANQGEPGLISNWTAPAFWSPAPVKASGASRRALAASTDLSGPLPFIPVAPCRVIDTRAGSGFPAGYGPPSIAGGGTQRSFTITGQCGIPAGAQAVSFNFAVFLPSTIGDLRVFPAGSVTPLVSTLNWGAGIFALANAAVVPLGSGGAITVRVDGAGTVDIFVDVNGYYGPTGSLPHGVSSSLASVNASPFYSYPVTVTLPTGGACLVTSQAQLVLSGSPTSNDMYFRIAIKRGGGADGDDTYYGHYFGPLSGFYSADMSRTSLITVNSNEATQFGCRVQGAAVGDQTGNLQLECQTSYLCF